MPKRSWLYWLIAIIVAGGFDLFFWNKEPGISVTLWIFVVLAAGVALNGSEGKKPSLWNVSLIALALGVSIVPAVRSDPLTIFMSLVICFISLCLLSFSYEKAYWLFYRIQDHVRSLLQLIGAVFTRPLGLNKPANPDPKPPVNPKQKTSHVLLSILRGVLIAIPVLGVLAALLASADPDFSQWLIAIFNLQQFPETLVRLIVITIVAYLLTGAYLHSAFPKKGELKSDDSQVIVKPFVGWIESGIVLLLVNILFVAFVVLQLRYLFGSQAGSGFTYSEYARRGFFELVAVAIISLLLYLLAGTVTRREAKHQKIAFTVLACLLIALVLVILVSSWQRLAQYEQAYGFSRLRVYTHVFIIWLAVLLVAAFVVELSQRQRWMGACLLVCVLGFGVTLASLNVDGFIVRQNLARLQAGFRFDTQYLSTLSNNAVPEIIEAFQDTSHDSATRTGLGTNLACRLTVLDQEQRPWQSFQLGESKAYHLLDQMRTELAEFPTSQIGNSLKVKVLGKNQDCFPSIPIGYLSD